MDYLGINFAKTKYGNLKTTQPQLISHSIEEVWGDRIRTTKPTLEAYIKIIHRYINAATFYHPFNYRSIVGEINYLEKGSRSDISYVVHKCAIFISNPWQIHANAIIHLCKCLQLTKYQGIVLNSNKYLQLEVYVNAYSTGNQNKSTALVYIRTAKSS